MILVKLDPAVAEVPIDINTSFTSIYWSYIYKSLFKRYYIIILSCCSDVSKSCDLHFDQMQTYNTGDF